MPSLLFKSCGLSVQQLVVSGGSCEPVNLPILYSVDNQPLYTNFLNRFLTVFSHVTGGFLRRSS
jgi:hypothetical protein